MPDHEVAGVRVSPREVEVLTALGEYLTNPEIAARLFISIRTVESHVSSLLRKLGVSDRRALAAMARDVAATSGPVLPQALTPLVGRLTERQALARALDENRLVTAVGPGGVGKTRLALAVAADVVSQDGVRYVDLVPVTGDAMVPQTVAAGLGVAEENLTTWAANRRLLLVLDNCEHVVDGVVVLVEQLLRHSADITVLATSRVRLSVPFERVFPVSGLAPAEAAQLFVTRAEAAGATQVAGEAVGRICAALDGVPLAIELAAARVAAVGLDGVSEGLADQLSLLAGARRVDDRHRSLRSALDWSYQLLDEHARTVLRRVSVFATGFGLAAAAAVTGEPIADVLAGLATLADHNLLKTVPSPDGTRYTALESVRQYGVELLAAEEPEVRDRHLRWFLAEGTTLLAADHEDTGWRAGFDRIADELRWALTRTSSGKAATLLAALCHQRGLLAEAQLRSEQAAELAATPLARFDALHLAAGSAEARHAGDDALRLRRAAGEAALLAGRPEPAARELARVVELVHRSAGIITTPPDPNAVRTTLADARRYAGEDPVALARIATAEAFAGSVHDPLTVAATGTAIQLAERSGDPLVVSAALDRLIVIHLGQGNARAALSSARRRTELLGRLPLDAELGYEINDAYGMAAYAAIAAQDLAVAREMARRCRDLPQNRESGHLATYRLIIVATLSGEWDEARAHGVVFLDAWQEAGRPRLSTLRRAAKALATVYAIEGAAEEEKRWSGIVDDLAPAGRAPNDSRAMAFFDAWVLLRRGNRAAAAALLRPDESTGWADGIWRPWHGSLREATARDTEWNPWSVP
ncbi:LuxR C-terminal-related transcriptional regulator [Streptomyces sp. MN03-5084-2B]|nr:LuxR C-terminal-related transcriptional regulator [Streptomyces sp. MN03-5084-2B]